MRTSTYVGFVLALLAIAGCDGERPMTTDDAGADAGMTQPDGGPPTNPDSGPRDAGRQPSVCDAPRTVTLVMGDQTITGDTSSFGSELNLGDGCGGDLPAPQEVIALTVPGSGPRFVSFSLATEGTDYLYDTVVQVRSAGCASLEGASCFDDIDYFLYEWRSGGVFEASGGSTVYMIVSGYAFEGEPIPSGPWEMSVSVFEAQPNVVLTAASARRVAGERYEFRVTGTDPNGDVGRVQVSLLDAEGNLIGFDLDDDPATPDDTEFFLPFSDLEDPTSFTDALAEIWDFPEFMAATATATQARIALVDRIYLDELAYVTEAVTVNIVDVTVGLGRGDACGETAFCSPEYECVADVCSIPVAVAAACAAPTGALAVAADTPATATGTLMVDGSDVLISTCGYDGDPEHIYTVTVPAGSFDLIVSTVNEATSEQDTVVYVQSTCGDPATELACNDDEDADEDVFTSTAVVENVAEGTYTVLVEAFVADEDVDYQLDVRLRPVLGPDATCDPTEVANRCSTGTCPAGATPVCPAAAP